MKKNTWYPVKDQSLAIYARNAGFDLTVYSQYSRIFEGRCVGCFLSAIV